MSNRLIAYIQLHIAVILYGWTAILGGLISISAVSLVWWRVMITSFSLVFFIGFGKKLLIVDKKKILIYMGIGVIVGMHWICFYSSVKMANASIALITMATTSLFTAIIEPLLFRRKFDTLEIVIGLMIIPCMILIAKNIDLSLIQGFMIGLLSAFLASLFASLNKKYVDDATPYAISFLEMFGAFVFISICLPFIVSDIQTIIPTSTDWVYLIILALLCTTLAFVLSMMALKHVSAFDSNLVINLEPIYGIGLAVVILNEHEQLTPLFYLGGILLMLIVFSHPILAKKINARKIIS
jgi:drug/metabolite transporter (DMT)-like permease